MPASFRHRLKLLLLTGLVSACAASPASERAAAQTPQHAFLARLRGLCGQAFAGRIVADTPPAADNPFAGKTLLMQVRECDTDAVRIPFHVGDDRSRTWVITLADEGIALRLKHDHRHADGSADAMTMYGGDSRILGTAPAAQRWRWEFPADAESQALFRAQQRAVSVDNVWALELDAQRFVYELARPGRLFRVEFDLTRPQPAPAAPWGVKPETMR
jgi:hypothetical protein